ncbi:MAG: hypothetical protein GTO12_26165 [Proteobacteria bacterium]|nr:hypothetical protein [Pseudomonadota bacterium]
MMSALYLTLAVGSIVAGVAGLSFGRGTFEPYAIWFLTVGLVVTLLSVLKLSYYQSGKPWPAGSHQPLPLRLTWIDYLKVMACWLHAFRLTYAVMPGLYHTGEHYDKKAPILVTSNYLLTIFLVVRRVRRHNARLLVIDTDGINVWCSAGEGAFSNEAIQKQLKRYDRELLTDGEWLTLILPKVGLSGVDLQALRNDRIKPVIGPLYAKDLPAYLSNLPYRDRDEDRVLFGLQSRLYSWLPGLVQFLGYSFLLALVLWFVELVWNIPVPLGLVGLTALIATAYPVLYPWIPGVRFAVKGLWLAAFISLGLGVLALAKGITPTGLIVAILFTFATSIFFALSYTGNSAVSNYSRVRKEIARFLPLNVGLYTGTLAAFLILEAL